MTPLTEDEKRSIVKAYSELRSAIGARSDDTTEKYQVLRQVYRGDLLGYVQAFDTANDKQSWVGQLGVYLRDEIEPGFW